MAVANSTILAPNCRAALAYHWYHGTMQFKEKFTNLSRRHSARERDSLWIAANLLCAASYGYLESHDPYDTWPLRFGPPTNELDWIKMNNGKRALWHIVQPYRADSVFSLLPHDPAMVSMVLPDGPLANNAFPPSLTTLLELDKPSSSQTTNPYHFPASILSHLIA